MNEPVSISLAPAEHRAASMGKQMNEWDTVPALEGFSLVSSTDSHPGQPDERCDVEQAQGF